VSIVALVPLAVVAAGVGALVVTTRRVIREVAELQRSLLAVQRLRPAVIALRQEANQVGQEALRLRSSRPLQ
jgi:hypothetical protein